MSQLPQYAGINKWFYENKRLSYKEPSNSYATISKIKYDNTERAYRIAEQRSHSYSVRLYF